MRHRSRSLSPNEPTRNGGSDKCAVALETFTIHPSPRFIISGSTAWARSIGAWTFTSKISLLRFNGKSISGW